MTNSKARKPSQRRGSPQKPALSRPPWARRIAGAILHAPRILRVVLVLAFSAAVALDIALLFYLADPNLIASEQLYLPVIVAVAFGIVMYAVGWLALVWTGGDVLPAPSVVLWYLSVGLLSLVIALIWAIQAATTWTTPF